MFNNLSKFAEITRMRSFVVMGLVLSVIFGTFMISAAFAAGEGGYPYPDRNLTPEEVQTPMIFTDPSGRITFKVQVVKDGLIRNNKCIVNRANGFRIGDDDGLDGAVCMADKIRYNISYTVAPSDKDTVIAMSDKFIAIDPNTGEIRNGSTYIQAPELRWNGDKTNTTFYSGGTGFGHTGKIENGTWKLTFPATTKAITVNGGDYDVQVWDRNVRAMNVFVSPNFTISDWTNRNNKVDSGILPYPTRAIGAFAIDPQLRMNINDVGNAKLIYKNGEYFYHKDYFVFYGKHYGADGISTDDPFAYFKMKTVVNVSMFPKEAQFKSNDPDFSYADGKITFASDNKLIKSTAAHAGDPAEEHIQRFSVDIPIGAYPADFFTADYYPFIEDFNATSNVKGLLYPNGWLIDPLVEPGHGQPKDYDSNSKPLLPDGQHMQVVNNSWGMQKNNDYNYFRIKKNDGIFYKELWNDENGKPGSMNIEYSNSDSNRTGKIGRQYWAEMGVIPNFLNMTDTRYCDAWDNRFQKIDTSRDPIVYRNTDGKVVESKNYKIEYGTYSRDLMFDVNKGPQYMGNEKKYLDDACGPNSTVSWSSTPNASSNITRVTFTGTTEGLSPENPQRVYIPFTTTSEEDYQKNFPDWPNAVRVMDRMVVTENGTPIQLDENAMTWIKGNTFDFNNIAWNITQNAGSTTEVNLGSWNTYSGLDKAFDKPIETYPIITFTFGSAISSIDMKVLLDRYDLVSFDKADFGPDGLPGTDDDVHGWTIKVTYKKNNPYIMYPADGTNNPNKGVSFDYSAIRTTIPGYIKNGTQIPFSKDIQLDPEFTKQTGIKESNLNNNKVNVNITVNAISAVTQSKWEMSQTEIAGNDIGWGVNWANNSTVDVGETVLWDTLPYNGDARGTKITAPLSNVRFDSKMVGPDTKIYVTDADPKTINKNSVKDGSIKFVEYSERASLAGNITAFKIIDPAIKAGDIRLVQVTASTKSSKHGDVVFNNLEEASVVGMMNAPRTEAVRTNLVTPHIHGTVWGDFNSDKKIQPNEPVRYSNVTVGLFDSNGNEVARTKTTETGEYNFDPGKFGDFVVKVIKEDGSPVNGLDSSTGESKSVPINASTPVVNDVDFGYSIKPVPGVSIDKKVSGIQENSEVIDGTKVEWTFVVTNTGNTILTELKVNDDVIGAVTCPSTTLQPGKSMECKKSGDIHPTAPKNVVEY